MKRLGNKGFTLIELIATLVVLSIVMGIGAYSVTSLITNAKEKDYELLVKEIKNAVELYYQECKYSDNSNIVCPVASEFNGHDSYSITLNHLVNYGFLKTNAKDDNGNNILVNPNDNKDISDCEFRYMYYDGRFWYGTDYEPGSSCPELIDWLVGVCDW